jgi:hypothetical protein
MALIVHQYVRLILKNWPKEGPKMMKAAVVLFILGLFAAFLGNFGALGLAPHSGEMLLVVFLLFSLICFAGGWASRQQGR